MKSQEHIGTRKYTVFYCKGQRECSEKTRYFSVAVGNKHSFSPRLSEKTQFFYTVIFLVSFTVNFAVYQDQSCDRFSLQHTSVFTDAEHSHLPRFLLTEDESIATSFKRVSVRLYQARHNFRNRFSLEVGF